MPLRERNRFLAACETIEKHEAANNEVAQDRLLRSENTDRRPPLERIRADHPKFYDQRKKMKELSNLNLETVVEIRGLEPLTSCMPCTRRLASSPSAHQVETWNLRRTSAGFVAALPQLVWGSNSVDGRRPCGVGGSV